MCTKARQVRCRHQVDIGSEHVRRDKDQVPKAGPAGRGMDQSPGQLPGDQGHPRGVRTRDPEEWAERLGIDLNVFQRKTNNETTEEKAERIAKAKAEIAEIRKEWGVKLTPEEEAEMAAVLKRIRKPKGGILLTFT